MRAQRQSDLVKINRSLGLIQNNQTNMGVEVVAKQQELKNYFNYVLERVSLKD